MTDAIDFDVIVKRRPYEGKAFVCVICRKTIKDEWAERKSSGDIEPICLHCTYHWSRPLGQIFHMSTPDQLSLMRLKAITTRLQWEVINGRL